MCRKISKLLFSTLLHDTTPLLTLKLECSCLPPLALSMQWFVANYYLYLCADQWQIGQRATGAALKLWGVVWVGGGMLSLVAGWYDICHAHFNIKLLHAVMLVSCILRIDLMYFCVHSYWCVQLWCFHIMHFLPAGIVSTQRLFVMLLVGYYKMLNWWIVFNYL